MKLLLLLSALLSALSGAGAGTRPAHAAVAVARAAAPSASVRLAVPNSPARPVSAIPLARLVAVDGPVWALAPAAPLYLSRRRE